MESCKHSIWKILSGATAWALMLPRIALGEFGVCPPYSKTFGPDDPPGDIVAFVNSASVRPGGATARLLPGEYSLAGLTPVSGVLCIQGVEETGGARATITEPDLIVAPGGLFTLLSAAVPVIRIQEGAHLFALGIEQISEDFLTGLTIDAGGFAQIDASVMRPVENAGRLILTNSEITDSRGTTLYNSGTLYLGQVALHHNTPAPHKYSPGTVLENRGMASVWGSTIARNDGAESFGGGIFNYSGYLEIQSSIVAENFGWYPTPLWEYNCDSTNGEFVDLGYNVFSPAGLVNCALTEPTSETVSPEFIGDFPYDWSAPVELGASSPAIDRIPLELCSETDALGRARTDGNGDGIVACDAGALEYGYGFVEARVRALPYYWREIGEVDLGSQTALYMYVFSTETFDATSLVPESIRVEGFEDDARRGFAFYDPNGDGLTDVQTRYRLDRMPPLSCGYHDHRFSAMTEDAREVAGQLKFDAVGCLP